MDDHIVILDVCHYSRENNGTCILEGWMYMGEQKEQPVVQVRADHIPLECHMKRTPRPDVIAARPELSFTDEYAGFEIRIPNVEQILSLTADTLRVRICCDGETYPVMKKEMTLIREEYFKDSIRYHLECMERRFDTLYIQGWCISTWGGLNVTFLDERGEKQKDVIWRKVHRSDLVEAFHVKEECCYGFIIEVPRDKVKSKILKVVFSNAVTKREEIFDMNKFDKENTKLGRILKTVNRKNFPKNREIFRERGFWGFIDYVQEESCSFAEAYTYYAKKHQATPKELREQAKERFSPAPLFSIVVPLYETPLPFLKELIDSVQKQSYANWQLCLADGSKEETLGEYIQANYKEDSRIVYRHLEENTGISGNTNGAIEMATGDYIAFADHDDTLTVDALYQMAKMIRQYPDTELIYSDEDKVTANGREYFMPNFKPDFNLDYLRSVNYICHLVVVKKTLLQKVGGLRAEFDGAQDHDFLLRCTEHTDKIRHIPKVLYHWRSHEGSTAGSADNKQYAVDAGKRALEEHYRRLGIAAEVEFTGIYIMYRTKFLVQGSPKISILIPNKDHIDDLEKCITSIREKSTWKNYEIIVIENNSENPETFQYYRELEKDSAYIRVIRYEGGFNYSAINNYGAGFARGEYLILLNNDTEIITPDWMEQMVGCCQRENVAITGAKLYYPDDTVQHAGAIIGIGGCAGHILVGCARNYEGYMGRLKAMQDLSAVTAACLMVKKSVFDEVGGLDEGFAVAFNDMDFCLRVRESGKLIVFIPSVELYHFESKSRGLENTPEKIRRFEGEIGRFRERHAKILKEGDPYYNPNLTLALTDCSLRKAHENVWDRQ